MPPRAVIFDFNGTISDDEPLLFRLLGEELRKAGVELDPDTYFGELAGHSDPEIIDRALVLGGVEPTAELREAILQGKIDAYKEAERDELTVSDDATAFVREVAARVPVAVASGAVREEVEMVLELAGLLELFVAIVCIDDVEHGKPDPGSYLLATAQLNEHLGLHESIIARDVLVIEDSPAGVTAAKAAGAHCAVVAGDERAEAAADFVISELTGEAAVELFARGERA